MLVEWLGTLASGADRSTRGERPGGYCEDTQHVGTGPIN